MPRNGFAMGKNDKERFRNGNGREAVKKSMRKKLKLNEIKTYFVLTYFLKKILIPGSC